MSILDEHKKAMELFERARDKATGEIRANDDAQRAFWMESRVAQRTIDDCLNDLSIFAYHNSAAVMARVLGLAQDSRELLTRAHRAISDPQLKNRIDATIREIESESEDGIRNERRRSLFIVERGELPELVEELVKRLSSSKHVRVQKVETQTLGLVSIFGDMNGPRATSRIPTVH